MAPRQRRSSAPGFTLIEVLVALAIVAVALAAGLRASAALAQQSERAAALTLAKWCTGNVFSELRLSRQLPAVGDHAVGCEQAGRSLVGRMTVRPTDNALFRRIELSFDDGDGRVALRMVTLASVQ